MSNKREFYISLNINFKVQTSAGLNITTLTSSMYNHVSNFLSVLQTLGTGTQVTEIQTSVNEIRTYDEDDIDEDDD